MESKDKKKSKSLLQGVGVYAIGTFGTKILSFFIVPLYTYYIAKSDMGVYDILISTINLLTPLVTLQISDAAYKWVIRDDIKDKGKYIRTTVQVLLINCSIALAFIFLVNSFVYSIPYCTYFGILLFLSRALQTFQKLLRALKKQMLFAISGLCYTIVFLSLNLIQLCVFHKGIECLFQGAIIAYIVAILLILCLEPQLRFNIFKKIDTGLVKEMYKFSVPLVPNYLNWWVINSSDRYIVLFALGSDFNGLLAIAHKFPSMLQAVLGLFTNSWQDLSVADTDKSIGEYYTSVFRKYYRLALTGLFFIVPLTKIIIVLIMSAAYKESCDYVAFYYLGTVFQSFASFYGVGYLRSGKTKKAFTTSVFGAIVNAAVNIGLISFIGMQAAAISTFVGFMVMWLIRERDNRNELMIKIKWIEFIGMTVAAVLICILSINTYLIGNIIIFAVGLAVFSILNRKEIVLIFYKVKDKLLNNKHQQHA
jgi:O-antigen/teichoic acid export membrane protein